MRNYAAVTLSAVIVAAPMASALGQQVPPLDNGMSGATPSNAARQNSNNSGAPAGAVSFPPPVTIGVPADPLNKKQRAALGIARKRIAPNKLPRQNSDGVVEYDYNHGEAFVVCAPNRICDIRLESGEIINGGEGAIALTDSANWKAIPRASGSRASLVTVVSVFVKFADIEASMAFSTNKGRHYNIRLRSTRNEYMPMTTFAYPDDELKKAQAEYQRQVQQANSGPNFDIASMFCSYSITGDAEILPIAVCSDGQRTLIDFGRKLNDIPAIVGILERGNWFKDDKREVLNASYFDSAEGTTKLLVDSVVSTAALVSGVANTQREVLIERRN